MLKHVLDFILNEDRLNQFFLHLAWMAPVAGICIGWLAGAIKKRNPCLMIWGLMLGLTGSLISGLWTVYNLIMNYYGLDSVAGLLINMGLFVFTGVLLGLVTRYFLPLRSADK